MDTPVIDTADLMDRFGEDRELITEVTELFFADFERRLGDLRECLANEDHEEMARIAHSLKGASSNLSALGMTAATKRVESLVRARRTDELLGAIQALENTAPALRRELCSIARGV